MTITIHWFQCK